MKNARSKQLLALGIPQWFVRKPLGGAPDARLWERRQTRPSSDQEAAAPRPQVHRGRELTVAAAVTARDPSTALQQPAVAQATPPARPEPGLQTPDLQQNNTATLRYCAVLRPLSNHWFLLSEGDPVSGSDAARLFVQDLLQAMGLDPAAIGDARRLDWPPPGGERLAADPVMGREALHAFLQTTGDARVLCISPRIAGLLGSRQNTMISTPGLADIMSSADARRETWKILGSLDERKS